MTETISSALTIGSAGGRATAVQNLKVLKTPEEGGTKKDYDDFVQKVNNHVMVH